MRKINSFFKLAKFEVKKVLRNKVVFGLLICFSLLMLISMSFASTSIKNVNIGIISNTPNYKQSEIIKIFEDNIENENFVEIPSLEDGLAKIDNFSLDLLIVLNNASSPQKAEIFYNASNNHANSAVSALGLISGEIIQQNIDEHLANIGITIKEDYFKVVTFSTTNANNVTFKNKFFSILVGTSISITLMFGMAYLMARENETQTIKNICYMPIGKTKYLFSKFCPFVLLGIFEILISLVFGNLLYGLNYETNFMLIALISILFIFSCIAFSLLICNLKSQISTALVSILTILLPLFSIITSLNRSLPIFSYILHLTPIMPFFSLLDGMIFSGVVLWQNILILICQTIVYYSLALLCLHKKVVK